MQRTDRQACWFSPFAKRQLGNNKKISQLPKERMKRDRSAKLPYADLVPGVATQRSVSAMLACLLRFASLHGPWMDSTTSPATERTDQQRQHRPCHASAVRLYNTYSVQGYKGRAGAQSAQSLTTPLTWYLSSGVHGEKNFLPQPQARPG